MTYRTLVRNSLLAAILGLLMTSQAGCLLLAVGAGTGAGVAYVSGKSEVMMDGNPVQVAAAAEKAAKEMSLVVVSNTADAMESKVVSRTADDARIVVYAKAVGDHSSQVNCRMGVFGDDAMQYRMIERVKANLPEAVAAHPDRGATTRPTATADAK